MTRHHKAALSYSPSTMNTTAPLSRRSRRRLLALTALLVFSFSHYQVKSFLALQAIRWATLRSSTVLAQSLDQFLNRNSTTVSIQPTRDIPDWLKEYTAWHREQRANLTIDNWNVSRKYLVMQCLERDQRCGGTADRLKPIITLLFVAYQYKRILLIRWERPCKLEEFVQPPPNGLDWRVPHWLEPKLGARPIGTTIQQLKRWLKANNGNDIVVRSRYQSGNYGEEYYNEQLNNTGEATFQEVYHAVWHSIFQPVEALQKRIDETMNSLSLLPGGYAAAHLRALYGVKSRHPLEIRDWAIHAVNCASQLRPGGPIYFASDSEVAVHVIQQYALNTNRSIVSLQHENEPLHLEKANHSNRAPSEYFDTFVDLYMLGNSNCLAYNVGGFGTWGLLLGYNSSCGFKHSGHHPENYTKCLWADA